MENRWKFVKKFKIELSYDPSIPLMGILPKKAKKKILSQKIYELLCSLKHYLQ